jgi:GNAT superfamily N-acetyltransferase
MDRSYNISAQLPPQNLTGVSMLTIRPATHDDVPMIKRLIEELAEFEHLPVSVTEENLVRDGFGLQPKFRVLMAEWQNQTAGYAFFFDFYSTFESRHGLYLEDVYVRPEFRGKGIGKAFFARIAKLAQDENCFAVRWQVLDWNQPAIDFYGKLGGKFLKEWQTVELEEEFFDPVIEGGN